MKSQKKLRFIVMRVMISLDLMGMGEFQHKDKVFTVPFVINVPE
jgi:hypothetical protein